jgi:CheY-like chemotaxis protein
VILIVDDEESIRALICGLLERAGYAVQEAASGEEALRILQQMRTAPELMLTDIVMPGISGLELAAHAHHLQPAMPVIFMSGFSNQYEEELSGSVCLRKPFRAAELVTVVEGVIGPAHPA